MISIQSDQRLYHHNTNKKSLKLQKLEDWRLIEKDKKQSNYSIDSIAFSFIINWHLYLNSKELVYLSLYYFF